MIIRYRVNTAPYNATAITALSIIAS